MNVLGLSDASSTATSTVTKSTPAKGAGMGWAAAIGAIGGAVTDVVGMYMSQKRHEDQMSLLKEQLTFQKEQHTEAVNRYNTAKANQEKGIEALGASFGEALARDKERGAGAFNTPQAQPPSQTLAGTESSAGTLGTPTPAQSTTPVSQEPAQTTSTAQTKGQIEPVKSANDEIAQKTAQLPTQRM